MFKLNPEWSTLMANYAADHRDPRNQACHAVGIPLIAASVPVGATIVGFPAAVGLFAIGWTFQYAGHVFEGKKPSFIDDRRYLAVGLVWWLKKMGMPIELSASHQSAA